MKREPLDVSVYMPIIVGDWLTGGATFTMSNRQRGAFFQLLCHGWKLGGSLPDDMAALAKYADEPREWLESPEGAAVLAQFPVDADGRRRNRKQVAVYADSVDRRRARHDSAVGAARARWARERGEGANLELVLDTSAPNFADAIGAFPQVVAFAALSESHTKALHRALMRVVKEVGEASLSGFIGEVNAALSGMHGTARTPDEIRQSLEDWCDNLAPVNKNALRAYFRGARRPDAPSTGGLTGRRSSSRPSSPVAASGADAAWKFGQ